MLRWMIRMTLICVKLENPSLTGEDMDKSKVPRFYGPPCIPKFGQFCLQICSYPERIWLISSYQTPFTLSLRIELFIHIHSAIKF